jgi:hypothetical protein
MKKLLLTSAAILSMISLNTHANSVVFEKTDDNFDTQICYAAATNGIEGAERLVTEKGLSFRTFKKNLTCNDKDLVTFARQYTKRNLQGTQQGSITLVAKNNDVESRICIESLTQGMTKIAAKYKINTDYIRCNGKPLPRFVRENKQRSDAVAALPK